MRKGTQIAWVRIVDKHIEAVDKDGAIIKITRAQRDLLSRYKNPNYVEDIKKAFSNDDIVANDFVVIKNGNQVYPR